MDFIQAEKKLAEAEGGGIQPGLTVMRTLMHALGGVQDKVRTVHIAGTNGKGSTAGFISEIATAAGLKTGCYRSPALIDFRQNILVDGAAISKEDATILLEQIFASAEKVARAGLRYPTRFELETALAFLYFAHSKCDLAIIEAGMGGRDDATNVITSPVLSVITVVSMDHVQYLGNSIKDIALAKAGIIKPKIPLITAAAGEAARVIDEECKKNNSPIFVLGEDKIDKIRIKNNGQSFRYSDSRKKRRRLKIAAAAAYQRENAALAVEAVYALQDAGLPIQERHIKKGLHRFALYGRFSILKGKPIIIIDGAHNVGAATQLMQGLKERYPKRKKIFVTGIFADKDYVGILQKTAGAADKIIALDMPQNKRLLRASVLAGEAKKYHGDVYASTGIEDAVKKAFESAKKKDVIVFFGSLSTISAVTEEVKKARLHTTSFKSVSEEFSGFSGSVSR